jgi:hypothetical protein
VTRFQDINVLNFCRAYSVSGTWHIPQMVCADGCGNGKYLADSAICTNLHFNQNKTPSWDCQLVYVKLDPYYTLVPVR